MIITNALEMQLAVRLIYALQMHDLEQAGIISAGDYPAWQAFQKHPFGWFITADADHAERLWRLLQDRRELPRGPGA